MPTLADFFLPAKGIFNDGPISGDIEFFKDNEQQIVGCHAMIQERIDAACIKETVGINKLFVKFRFLEWNTSLVGGYFQLDGAGAQKRGPSYQVVKAHYAETPPTTFVTATADPGYAFIGWSGDISGLTNPKTLPDQAHVYIFANFKKIGDPDPPLITSTILKNDADPIDSSTFSSVFAGLRGAVEFLFSHYLNSVVHPGGSIENVPSYTVWTKAAIFAAAGVGVSGDWTAIPASNAYGLYPSYGPIKNVPNFKEHVNEILSICDFLEFPVIPATQFFPAGGGFDLYAAERTGVASSSPDNFGNTCPTDQANATTDWNSNSFVSVTPNNAKKAAYALTLNGGTSGNRGGNYKLFNRETKVGSDLTKVPTGTAHVYLKAIKPAQIVPGSPAATLFFGESPPVSSAENNYGEWSGAGMVVGSVQLTPYITGSTTIPVFSFGCPPTPGQQYGWEITDQVVVVTGISWTYFL